MHTQKSKGSKIYTPVTRKNCYSFTKSACCILAINTLRDHEIDFWINIPQVFYNSSYLIHGFVAILKNMDDAKDIHTIYHKDWYSFRESACDVLSIQTSHDKEMDLWIGSFQEY